jgi:GABA(A) receptor-associated protein
MSQYQKNHSFTERKSEIDRIRQKYPQKVPVVVERAKDSKNVPDIDKNKFLVPEELTVGQFMFVIRKRIKLAPEQALFIFVNNELPPTSAIMSHIYEKHKSECGFLYTTYSGESCFGK